MEIGIFSFGELTSSPESGTRVSAQERMHQLIELARIADEGGLDVVGIGEHHRPDFAVASPAILLAAIAQATSRIRLTSSVTVLSTADPVRVFEDFAALDLISDGRAEITAGRGAYVESFPLYGCSLDEYESLFEEKLELLLRLRRDETVTWSGRHRPSLDHVGVFPRPVQEELPVWIAVGGTPASVERAGRFGLPLYFAILGNPAGFAPLAALYRETALVNGHEGPSTRLGISSHFYVEETSQGARDTFYPYYSRYIGENMPGRRTGPLARAAFDEWASPRGALFVGSPQEVIEKILWEHEVIGHDRFLAQVGLGGLPQPLTARSVEQLSTQVAPAVRAAIGVDEASP